MSSSVTEIPSDSRYEDRQIDRQTVGRTDTSPETLQCLLKVDSTLFIYLINSPGGLMSSSVTEIPSDSRYEDRQIVRQTV